jgi:hypothetical protein
MPDQPSPPNTGDAAQPPPRERRQNVALRELIDEMMASIRTATQGNLWTSDERTQYERELAMIMGRVRSAAVGADEQAGSIDDGGPQTADAQDRS